VQTGILSVLEPILKVDDENLLALLPDLISMAMRGIEACVCSGVKLGSDERSGDPIFRLGVDGVDVRASLSPQDPSKAGNLQIGHSALLPSHLSMQSGWKWWKQRIMRTGVLSSKSDRHTAQVDASGERSMLSLFRERERHQSAARPASARDR
jgi:hypothetical protein